jgi:hypothetical protein
MKIKLEPHYSGDLSKKFWELVNSLPDQEQGEMYLAGVLLQDMERKILGLLKGHTNANIKEKG